MYSPSQKPPKFLTLLSVLTVLLLIILIAEVGGAGGPSTIQGNQIKYVTVVDTYVSTTTLYSTAVSTTTINGSYAQALSGIILAPTTVSNIPGVGTGRSASFTFTVLAFFSHYYLKYSVNGGNQSASVGYRLGGMSGSLKGTGTLPLVNAFNAGPTYTVFFQGNDATDTITFSVTGSTS